MSLFNVMDVAGTAMSVPPIMVRPLRHPLPRPCIRRAMIRSPAEWPVLALGRHNASHRMHRRPLFATGAGHKT